MDRFCIHDNILDEIINDELVTTLLSNEPQITESIIYKVFNEILEMKIKNAEETLKNNMNQILKICNDNR